MSDTDDLSRRGVGLVVFVGMLVLDVGWSRSVFPGGFHSLAGYIASAAILLVAVVWMSVAFTPRSAWRTVAMVFIVVLGWGAAALLGSMFATCDRNMRPFLGELLLLLPLSILSQSPGIIAVMAFSILSALVAWGVTRVVGPRIPRWVPVGLVVAVPFVFFLTTAVLSISGSHPVRGNCVI